MNKEEEQARKQRREKEEAKYWAQTYELFREQEEQRLAAESERARDDQTDKETSND